MNNGLQALSLYVKAFAVKPEADGNEVDTEEFIFQNRARIQILILQFLATCRPEERFANKEIIIIINKSATMDSFHPGKAAQAFKDLESYLLLLYWSPWKAEYHKLKKYGGFYQTKIESHLSFTDYLFQLIGFKETSNGVFQLCNPQTPNFLITLAFECFKATCELKLIENVWNRVVKLGVSARDVVALRGATAGTEAYLVNNITKELSVNVVKNKPDPDDDQSTSKSAKNVSDSKNDLVPMKGDSVDPFRTKLNKHISDVKNINLDDIPFMDEMIKECDYTEGNFDDHLRESLQVVGEKEREPEIIAPAVGSQEWSFVNEGLTKKYGKGYFQGPRKDILADDKNPKYVQLFAKDPVVSEPKYVNVHTGKPSDYAQFSILTKDSDYYSTSQSPYVDNPVTKGPAIVYYPPGTHSHSDTIAKRTQQGIYSHSDTIAVRSAPTAPVSSPEPLSQNSHMAISPQPIAPHPPARNDVNKLPKRTKHTSISNQPMTELSDPKEKVPRLPTRVNSRSLHVSGNVADGRVPLQRQMSASLGRPSVGQGSNKWACSHCTFLNTAADNVCVICSKSREHTDTDGVSVGTTLKICSQCTLENDRTASTCTACGGELRKSQTMV